MPWYVIAFLALILGFAIWEQLQKPRRRREAQERDDLRAREAAARGWALHTERSEHSLIHRYSGTTDGIAWTLETNSWTSRDGERTRNFTRWSTASIWHPDGVLAIWPSFGEADKVGADAPQFILKLVLTPLMTALESDHDEAALLSKATPVAEAAPAISGSYLLRATHPQHMTRLLDAGGREALVDAAQWLPRRDAQNHLVLALFRQRGLGILVSDWVDDFATMERVATFGARLANAYRKGSS